MTETEVVGQIREIERYLFAFLACRFSFSVF